MSTQVDFRRRSRRFRLVPTTQELESRCLLAGWLGYAANAQHTAPAPAPAQSMELIHWQTPVDLDPQYSGGDLLIHYGSPMITPSNTVIVPVKTGATGGFRVEARNATTGALIWSQNTDYVLPPHNWVPSFSPTLTPGNRLYVPSAGGTVQYINNPDTSGTIGGRIAFYGTYVPSQHDANVWVNTPITSDASGNIYFGFQVSNTPPGGLSSGIARIAANGTATWISAAAASQNASGINKVVMNCAPAISNDGQFVYVAVSTGNFGSGYLVKLNAATLAPVARVQLLDPSANAPAALPDDGTASPMVGPDGDVYFGVLEHTFASNHDRGWLLHFNGDLTVSKTPGLFGWDVTPSVVPLSMVPGYTPAVGTTYLLMCKYNNYAGLGTTTIGDGVNKMAILDPNSPMSTPDWPPSLQVMREVRTIAGPTPDPEHTPQYPNAVREWCINTAVVDPATGSVYANSEDGVLYRWDLASNTFTQQVRLTVGIGEAYTPTLIGNDGTVYAINNGTLFALGQTAPLVADAGFEQVSVGPPGSSTSFAYAPPGSPWTFGAGAGIASNGSAFTNGNPSAPQGVQVAFLQGTGTMNTTISNWLPGNYRIRFQSAQRGNYQASYQDLDVLVDGASVGTVRPSGSAFASYLSGNFTVTAGAHSIGFRGRNSMGGDNTAFIDAVSIELAPTSVVNLADAGFEQVSVGPPGSASSFAYTPAGSPWTFTGGAGISSNGSAFTSGNPSAPQGVQVAFLQGTGAMNQSIAAWPAGTYFIRFQAAQRGNFQAAYQDVDVLMDGSVISTIRPVGTGYATYMSSNFVVAAGTHSIGFRGRNTAGGDNTALIDAISIEAAPANALTVPDSGFEQTFAGPPGVLSSYVYNPAGSPWAFSSSSGIASNGSGFTSGNPGAPQGAQVAFIQGTGTITQTIAGWQAGGYVINLAAAQRGSFQASYQDFDVLVDNVLVTTIRPTDTTYRRYQSGRFVVTAGAHSIQFRGRNTPGGDNTVLLDDIQVMAS